MRRIGYFFAGPIRLWRRSLPFQVVLTTLLASVVILTGTGWFLLDQTGRGVMDAKTQASLSEATAVLSTMRNQLGAIDPRTTSPNEQMHRIALEATLRGRVGNQYYLLVETPISSIGIADITHNSISPQIRTAIKNADGLYTQPTLVNYTDGRAPESGLVVATQLVIPGFDVYVYHIFFIFPTTAEANTLEVVRQASLATGLFLILGLSVTVYLIALQVLRPVRAARMAAERLATGHLQDRMRVVGTADLSALAHSMNNMAAELDKKITQLEDLSNLQQRFVSDVSHELRTPMTTIRMATEVIHADKETFDPPTKRSAELLATEVDRFEEMLTELLEISRFDAGAAVLTTDEVDLTKLVSQEVSAVATLAGEMNTELRVSLDSDSICEVDSGRIRRILRNLLTNGIEHGESRPIDIRVVADDTTVAVVVQDQGIGLDAAELEHVFDRFWRADPARNRRVGGTGLGLAIALEDARLHGGWLDVWGTPAKGAIFRLTLPRKAGIKLDHSPISDADIAALWEEKDA